MAVKAIPILPGPDCGVFSLALDQSKTPIPQTSQVAPLNLPGCPSRARRPHSTKAPDFAFQKLRNSTRVWKYVGISS